MSRAVEQIMNMEDAHPAMPHVARAVERFGRLWHAYEVRGWENLPVDRACLVVVYHGFFPLDCWFFAAAFHAAEAVRVRINSK